MPRYARQLSESGVYHVMLRGNERKVIFHDQEDKTRFLDTVQKMKEHGEFEIYAYCIMDNHVHLLYKDGKDFIHRSMKRIGISYSYYYNKKYKRVGHLFQDRYRSEKIDTDAYFVSVARYIHSNPVKAGIVENVGDYQWSSYRDYLRERENSNFSLNKKPILEIFSTDEEETIKMLSDFSKKTNEDSFIDYGNEEPEKNKLNKNMNNIIKIIVEKYGITTEEIKSLKDKKIRDMVLKEIKEQSKGSIRELSKIIGISKDIIFRA